MKQSNFSIVTKIFSFKITVRMADLMSIISRVQLAPFVVNTIKKSKWFRLPNWVSIKEAKNDQKFADK